MLRDLFWRFGCLYLLEIINMNERAKFLEKREKWLKEVAEVCHEYALEIDKNFYVFQTNSDRFRAEILFIGINPGGNESYSDALLNIKKYKNEDRRLWTNLGYDCNTLVEKPQWEIEEKFKGNDVMRNRLKIMFHNEHLHSKLKDSVFMNMFYFNTKKANDIKDLPLKMRNYCETKTLDFIKIIEPKNIIFFGSETNLKKVGLKNFKYLGDNIKTANLNDLNVFVIPHYGYYSAYSYENGERTGNKLSVLLK